VQKPRVDDDALVTRLLESLTGAALVLNADLRVCLATPATHVLLGFEVPRGASAPKILCGDTSQRPVADALAAGRPIQTTITRPIGPGQTSALHIKTQPIHEGQHVIGWLISLEPDRVSGNDATLFHGLWTRDPKMRELFRIITRVAREEVTVLVRGETGTGKEHVARALHDLSPRKDGPFRAINCAALPDNLLESELFGHVRGAFTGAHKDTPGHMQLADQGTLFLDEVAELPLDLQAKLLRVIETRTVIPVGGRNPISIDIRIISATHRALRKEAEAGRFRADLMYRLRVIPLYLPALRERRVDIELLCERFVAEMNPSWRRKIESISRPALDVLERHDWPGNVRELKNVLAYAYAIGDGPILLASDLPPSCTTSQRYGKSMRSSHSVARARLSRRRRRSRPYASCKFSSERVARAREPRRFSG
jgi:transcriptional regulator with PAS, ATPase and Fis domain